VAAKPRIYRLKGRPSVYGFTGRPAVYFGRGASVSAITASSTCEGIGNPSATVTTQRDAGLTFSGIGSLTLATLNRNIEARGVGSPEATVSTLRKVSAIGEGIGSPVRSQSTLRKVGGTAQGFIGSSLVTFTGLNFLQMIQVESAANNLDFCLDAADADSYPGTGQTWFDLTANGNNFFRGNTSSAASDDPTFNGTPDGLSAAEYFSYDGGDFFTDAVGATFADTWHKDNGVFTLAGVAQVPAGSNVRNILFASGNSITAAGNRLVVVELDQFSANTRVDVTVLDGLTSALAAFRNFPTNLAGSLVFWAVAINEATGADGLTIQTNDTRAKFSSSYASPNTSDPIGLYRLGMLQVSTSGGTINTLSANGSRTACIAGWSRRLSDSELDGIYARLKARYTSLP
jgi:hypothetical protein